MPTIEEIILRILQKKMPLTRREQALEAARAIAEMFNSEKVNKEKS